MAEPALDISDPFYGVRRTLRFDESERKLIVQNYQDCEDILAFNQALYNADRSSSSLWGGRGWVHVASIPNGVAEEWMKRDHLSIFCKEDMPKILARLSSNEFQKLRTAPGRLG